MIRKHFPSAASGNYLALAKFIPDALDPLFRKPRSIDRNRPLLTNGDLHKAAIVQAKARSARVSGGIEPVKEKSSLDDPSTKTQVGSVAAAHLAPKPYFPLSV